jgi:large subunit ribosomal protein L9
MPFTNPAINSPTHQSTNSPIAGFTMEVILREHVDNLGRRGDIVKVAAGYARNYLLPRKLALAVNEGNKRQIERERKNAEARELEEKTQAEAFATRLAEVEIAIPRRVGENDTLYGSVTTADIATSLGAKGFDVDRRKIVLAEPLKALGQVTVPIKIHRDVTAQVKVSVVAESK